MCLTNQHPTPRANSVYSIFAAFYFYIKHQTRSQKFYINVAFLQLFNGGRRGAEKGSFFPSPLNLHRFGPGLNSIYTNQIVLDILGYQVYEQMHYKGLQQNVHTGKPYLTGQISRDTVKKNNPAYQCKPLYRKSEFIQFVIPLETLCIIEVCM